MATPKRSQTAKYQGKSRSTFPKHKEMTPEETERANAAILELEKLVKGNV